jgi:hypothetical protein
MGCSATFSGQHCEECAKATARLFNPPFLAWLDVGGCLQFSKRLPGYRWQSAFERLDELITAQPSTSRIILMSHANCAYPLVKFNLKFPDQTAEQQFHIDETITLYQELSHRYPRMTFEAQFVNAQGDLCPFSLVGKQEIGTLISFYPEAGMGPVDQDSRQVSVVA